MQIFTNLVLSWPIPSRCLNADYKLTRVRMCVYLYRDVYVERLHRIRSISTSAFSLAT